MTDRHSGYVVILEKDIREDDAKATLAALRQIKGVLGVQPVENGGSMDRIITTSRNNVAWQEKLIRLIQEMQGLG